jgi:hypothetical protein
MNNFVSNNFNIRFNGNKLTSMLVGVISFFTVCRLLANCYDDLGSNQSYHNNNNYTVICDTNCGVSISQCHEYTYSPETYDCECMNPSGHWTGNTCVKGTDTTILTGRIASGQCVPATPGCSGQCVDWRDINPPKTVTYESDTYVENCSG